MQNLFRSNTFLKIFLPVTAVICVTVAIMTLLFSVIFEKAGTEALADEYRKNLHMIRNMYTEIHFAVIPAALSIFEDERVRDFLFSKQFRYDITLAGLKEIDKTLLLNNYIHSIYLYNKDYGFLSTSKGLRAKNAASDPTLFTLLHNNPVKQSVILPRRVHFEGEKEPENIFSFINGSFDSITGEARYAIVFNLSESKIRKLLVADYPENESEFYIVDSHGVFFSHPQQELFTMSSENNTVIRQVLAKENPLGADFFTDAAHERWFAAWSDQTELGWRFLYVIPEKKIFAKVTALRNKLVVVSTAVLVLSLSLLLFLIKRIQTRVEFEKKLAGYIQGISELTEKRLVTKKWFIGLLRFDLCNFEDKKTAKNEKKPFQLRRLAHFFSDFTTRHNKTLCVSLPDGRFCTLSEKTSPLFCDEFFAVRQKSVTEYHAEITAVYATTACSFDEIPSFYETLKNELQQTYMVSQGLSARVQCEEKKEKKLPADFDFLLLEQAFKAKNTDKIHAEIRKLQNYLFTKKDYFLFKTSVVQTGLLAAKIFEKSLDHCLADGMDGWRNALFQAEQISVFIALLHILTTAIDVERNFQTDPNYGKIARYVKNYVSANSNDKNLNAAHIAAVLGLSLNYVREVFKKTEKISISDYIGLYRVELAKQYFLGTDKTIYEICDIVGFTNYPYFSTYFKKIEGISPSTFRMNLRILK